jgi:SAM-dependent methyltransferase
MTQSFRLPGGSRRARRMVKVGYDKMAPAYAAWARDAEGNGKRNRWTQALAECLPPKTSILDLGCGPGHEVECWTQRGMLVTGVDLSAANIALARQQTPRATFIGADMSEVEFLLGSFEVAVAFYSLIHVPEREQARTLKRLYSWLKPGGLLLANMAARPFAAMFNGDWLGAPMFWSSLGAEEASRLLPETGFCFLRPELCPEINFGRKNTFFWFVAQRLPEGRNGTNLSSIVLQALNHFDPIQEQCAEGKGGEYA